MLTLWLIKRAARRAVDPVSTNFCGKLSFRNQPTNGRRPCQSLLPYECRPSLENGSVLDLQKSIGEAIGLALDRGIEDLDRV